MINKPTCAKCGNTLKSRQPKFCSHKCAMHFNNASRRGQTPARHICKMIHMMPTIVRMYLAGGHIKPMSKQLKTAKSSIIDVLKRAGIYNPEKGLSKNRDQRRRIITPEELIVWGYSQEDRKLRQIENLWSYHPAVVCWMVHWKDKKASCVRAMDRHKRLRHLPEYKIVKNLRHRIWFFTFRNNIRKSETTMQLVGCSPEELRAHLESQFKDGMGWHNYGSLRLNGWEIDHIKPCTAFDLTDEQAQRECFHYSNLQPMWKDENIRKGGRNRIKNRIPSF